jgi:hypothetical protein
VKTTPISRFELLQKAAKRGVWTKGMTWPKFFSKELTTEEIKYTRNKIDSIQERRVLHEILCSLLDAKNPQNKEVEKELSAAVYDKFELLQSLEDEQAVERSQKKLLKKKKAEELKEKESQKEEARKERWKKLDDQQLQATLVKEEQKRLEALQPYTWTKKMTWSKFFNSDLTDNKVEYVIQKLKSQISRQEIATIVEKAMECQMDEDFRKKLMDLADMESAKMEIIEREKAERKKQHKLEKKSLKKALNKQDHKQDEVTPKEGETSYGKEVREQKFIDEFFRVSKGDKGKEKVTDN